MKTVKLHEAKAHLSKLIEKVVGDEEVIISRYGNPVAKLSGLSGPNRRELGFYPVTSKSDLLEPTTDEVAEAFCA